METPHGTYEPPGGWVWNQHCDPAAASQSIRSKTPDPFELAANNQGLLYTLSKYEWDAVNP